MAEDQDALRERLELLRAEHRALDDAIAALDGQSPSHQLRITRMKKRKLVLKDEIMRLESAAWPDIIA